MNIYEEKNYWPFIIAGVIILTALLIKFLSPAYVRILPDSESVPPGGEMTVRVLVHNPEGYFMREVVVVFIPVSPHIHPDKNLVRFPSVPPGGTVQAVFNVSVDRNAYAGDHGAVISVALPGKTIVNNVNVRVG